MRLSLLRSVAASSLLLLGLCALAQASSRPRYGGTVHVLLHDRVSSLDPAAEADYPADRERISTLVYETLTVMDAQGRVHPLLATAWSSDASKRVWRFRLRLATFEEGSPFTAADAVAVLSKNAFGWKVTAADRQTVVIESTLPVIHMPELLALPRFAMVKQLGDNSLAGTGPFVVRAWQPGQRALLAANEDYWGGRPYPDAIEFQMGTPLRDELLQRQLGPYSAAEMPLDQLHMLQQANQNILLSRASDLMVLLFLQPDTAAGGRSRKPVDPRVREALADALNRAAISNFILQKHGIAASGLLPQWLTGYEFLFPGDMNLDRARELRADAAGLVIISPIALAYDFSDPAAKLAAERIALDAHEVGLTVQPYGEPHINSRTARASLDADAVLLRIPLASLDPSVALAALADDLGLSSFSGAALDASGPEDLYDVESRMLQGFRLIPIAHISQALWLNSGVHNWRQMPTGAWDLDQVWVEGAR